MENKTLQSLNQTVRGIIHEKDEVWRRKDGLEQKILQLGRQVQLSRTGLKFGTIEDARDYLSKRRYKKVNEAKNFQDDMLKRKGGRLEDAIGASVKFVGRDKEDAPIFAPDKITPEVREKAKKREWYFGNYKTSNGKMLKGFKYVLDFQNRF